MNAPTSGADVLARVKPTLREEHTQICLRPDLLDEWEAANTELAELVVAEASGRKRMGSGSSKTGGDAEGAAHSAAAKKLAKRIEEIEAQIVEHSIMFRFRALPKDEWKALTEQHPPRTDNQLDMLTGYDRDAVADAAVRGCLYDPVFEDCDEKGCEHNECGSWQQFLRFCSDGEWEELQRVAGVVNGRVNPGPKSELASRVLSRRAPTSRQRAGGQGRARAGGTAGSPSN